MTAGERPTRRRIAVMMVSVRSDGGAESLLRTLHDELVDEPYDFEVFTLKRIRDEHRRELADRGMPCHPFPARRLVSPRRFARLLRAVRAGRFDVIHTNLPPANILGALCGLLLRTPVVATLHNTETRADRHWYQGRAERFVLRHLVDRVIAVGDRTAHVRGELLDGTTIHVLHNAVAPSRPLTSIERDELRRSVMTDPKRRLLLTVGRLTRQKAHGDLIRALTLVRRRRGDVELAIAGRGPLHDALAAQISELGADDVVHLLGSRDDVRRLLHAADLFVMSSHWEGLPVAMLEAMEAGLPIVTTAVGDVPATLAGGCGRLVEPGDEEGLAAAIVAGLDDDSGATAVANRRVIEERHSSHAWAQAMTEHYEAVIGR